jgi:predicted AAA+ superfamily ATPase
MRSYLDELSSTDIKQVNGVGHDSSRVYSVLRSLARKIATKASNPTIDADARGSEGSLGLNTVAQYLDALARLMVTEDLPAWTPQLRSWARVRSASTGHFADPCLAVAALNSSPKQLLNDLNL